MGVQVVHYRRIPVPHEEGEWVEMCDMIPLHWLEELEQQAMKDQIATARMIDPVDPYGFIANAVNLARQAGELDDDTEEMPPKAPVSAPDGVSESDADVEASDDEDAVEGVSEGIPREIVMAKYPPAHLIQRIGRKWSYADARGKMLPKTLENVRLLDEETFNWILDCAWARIPDVVKGIDPAGNSAGSSAR